MGDVHAGMRALGVTPDLVRGLPVGNRMIEAHAPVGHVSDPPLQEGDLVEVLPGNGVRRGIVGRRGALQVPSGG